MIDEDPQIHAFIKAVVSKEAIGQATCFSDWASAEDFLQQTRPDLILLSMTLEDQSASQIADAIRTQQSTKLIPIIFTTTERDMIDLVEAIRAGADDVITKPFDARSLITKTDLILEQARPKFLQILMVDDDTSLHALVRNAVQNIGFHLETLEDPTQTLNALSEINPDLLLLDIDMPGMNGVEVCHAIRNHSKFQALPIIFLSSKSDEQTTVRGLRAGADDYVTKPFRVREFVARLQARVQRNELLTHQAHRDGLTQLYHNRYFQKQLSEIVFEAKRYKETFCLVMLDIDQFKNVNDTHGHLAGDRMLQELASFLNSRLRHTDMVARYGGDEFAILLQRIAPADCQRLMAALKDEFKEKQFHTELGDTHIQVTLSVGIAVFPHDGSSSGELIQAADQALYQSKQRGRDSVSLYNTE